MRPQIGTEKLSGGTVSDADTVSPYGRGALPFSGVVGRSLPVDVAVVPVLHVRGSQSVPLQVAVVRVDGTIAGDTSRSVLVIGDRRVACLWRMAVLDR